MRFEDLIERVLAREGGYANRPEDKGGPTNFGITQATYSAYLGRPATVEDMQKMQVGHARTIYLQMFVKDTGLDMLGSEAVREALFDWMVNSGPATAIRAMQRILGVVADGKLGQVTAAAANRKNGVWLATQICWARVTFIADWMRNDKRDADKDGVPDSMENAGGILRRIADLGRALT